MNDSRRAVTMVAGFLTMPDDDVKKTIRDLIKYFEKIFRDRLVLESIVANAGITNWRQLLANNAADEAIVSDVHKKFEELYAHIEAVLDHQCDQDLQELLSKLPSSKFPH